MATHGSTIYSLNSNIRVINIAMSDNIGLFGGCFYLLGTKLVAYNDVFAYNYADLGGMMYAIQQSNV